MPRWCDMDRKGKQWSLVCCNDAEIFGPFVRLPPGHAPAHETGVVPRLTSSRAHTLTRSGVRRERACSHHVNLSLQVSYTTQLQNAD